LIRRTIFHAGAHRHVAGPSVATRDARSATPVGFFDDSPNSYNGDDAWRFRHEWNAAIDRYSEATKQNGQLEFAFEAS